MTRNHDLHVKVSKAEHERIMEYADKRGFCSVSKFIRYMVLEGGFRMFDQMGEIHKAIVEQRRYNG